MSEQKTLDTPSSPVSIGIIYRTTLLSVIRNPATWFFCLIYFAAVGIVISTGNIVIFLPTFGLSLFILLPILIIIPITATSPAATRPIQTTKSICLSQLLIILIVISFTFYRVMIAYHEAPTLLTHIPILTPLALFTNMHRPFIINPILYILVPLLLLLPTRIHWNEIGFGRGYRAWTAALICGIFPLSIVLFALISGSFSFIQAIRIALSNVFANGFSEEFLIRGLLMTRLIRLTTPAWGIVLSSLIFGLWHIPAVLPSLHGNYLVTTAFVIASQGTFGLELAILFGRTRNLLAPTILHVLIDTIPY